MFYIFKKSEKQNKPAKRDDRGITLVEVIVSMLILSVVVIPVLSNFAVTARTNVKAKQINDASDFAQQIIENLQFYGVESVNSQFWDGREYTVMQDGVQKTLTYDGDDFNLADIINGGSYGPAVTGGIVQPESVMTDSSKSYVYNIFGAESAGQTYDVEITYDPAVYGETSDAENKYNEHSFSAEMTSYDGLNEFPDISAFSSDSTVVINPNGAYVSFPTFGGKYIYDEDKSSYRALQNSRYEDIILTSFYTFYQNIHQNICERVNAVFQRNDVSPENYINISDITDSTTESAKKAAISRKTARTAIVQLELDDKSKIAVSASMVFDLTDFTEICQPNEVKAKLSSIIPRLVDNNGDAVSASVQQSISDAAQKAVDAVNTEMATVQSRQLKYRVFYESEPMEELSDIYMMYYPLENAKWKSDTFFLSTSDEVNKLYENEKLNIYLVPQIGLLSMNSDDAITATESLAGNYEKLKFKAGTLVYGKTQATENVITEFSETAGYYSGVRVNYLKGYLDSNSGNSAVQNQRASIVKSYDPGNMLYRITVKVYRHAGGNEFDRDSYLTEMSIAGL